MGRNMGWYEVILLTIITVLGLACILLAMNAAIMGAEVKTYKEHRDQWEERYYQALARERDGAKQVRLGRDAVNDLPYFWSPHWVQVYLAATPEVRKEMIDHEHAKEKVIQQNRMKENDRLYAIQKGRWIR